MSNCSCCGGAPPSCGQPARAEQLAYRTRTYGSFFEAMRARLATLAGRVPSGTQAATCCLDEPLRDALAGGPDDAASALLDGFACVADVLTFYQERIVNEGYLRTAIEERSLRELGRLTGYAPRPGVAATVDVAFTVQPGFDGEVPARTKLQSQPRPGKDAQTFETSAPLAARSEWNAMRVRQRSSKRYLDEELCPGRDRSIERTGRVEIFLKGVDQNVRVGDLVLLEQPRKRGSNAWSPDVSDLFRVSEATPDLQHGQTRVRLVPAQGKHEQGFWNDRRTGSGLRELARAVATARPAATLATRDVTRTRVEARRALGLLRTTIDETREDPARAHSASKLRLLEPAAMRLALRAPGGRRMLAESLPKPLRENVLGVLQQTAAPPMPRAYVFRTVAQPFGHAAPKTVRVLQKQTSLGMITQPLPGVDRPIADDEDTKVVFLDGDHPRLREHGWVVVASSALPQIEEGREPGSLMLARIEQVERRARTAYELSGRTTRLQLDREWRVVVSTPPDDLPPAPADAPPSSLEGAIGSVRSPILRASGQLRDEVALSDKGIITPLRNTLFYVDADELALLPAPLGCDVRGATLTLEGNVEELPAGRCLILEGEISEPRDLVGTRHAERVYVAESGTGTDDGEDEGHDTATPDEGKTTGAPSTLVTLTRALEYTYKRDSVVIYGNVAEATHGETREQVLGSGDASLPRQTFSLRGKPRTWVSASTSPTGTASTLEVRVSGILWPEAPSFLAAGPRDEWVITRTGADGYDRVTGGDGVRGARFPTGVENITVRYRVGLGPEGAVAPRTIVTLLTKPMGVQSVVNPIAASGGAAPDDADAMRARIPLSARWDDRLVSLRDYENFALSFAGVHHSRASAGTCAEGRAKVQLVVSGAEEALIDETLTSLGDALVRFGDPLVDVDVRAAVPEKVQLEAAVRIGPRHLWSDVARDVRATLVERLGFARRSLGASMALSEVLHAMQSVPGVVAVDVNVFAKLAAGEEPPPSTLTERVDALEQLLARRQSPDPSTHAPAQLDVASNVLLYVSASSTESIHLTERAP